MIHLNPLLSNYTLHIHRFLVFLDFGIVFHGDSNGFAEMGVFRSQNLLGS